MTDDTRRTINTFLGSRSAHHEPTAARGLTGILTLIAGGALIWLSLPYASAFVNVGEIVGVSKIDRTVGKFKAGLTKTAPVKKVYLRAGQGLTASYNVPKGAKVTLSVMRCQSRPIIEVWNCAPVAKQDIIIKGGKAGMRSVIASAPGFYYFTDTMTLPKAADKPYTLVWRRT